MEVALIFIIIMVGFSAAASLGHLQKLKHSEKDTTSHPK